jgi:hypothetical protein
MTIDRRDFVTGIALTATAPALTMLLPVSSPSFATAGRHPVTVMMIEGWSAPDESGGTDAAWIRIGHSWRTAWR